jgi:DNA-binding GntR family transcriptional regulator
VLVAKVDPIGHLELLEVRRPLESSIVRHVIERAMPADLEELKSLADELSEAAAERNRDRYFRTKRLLHECEVRAAYNPVLRVGPESLRGIAEPSQHEADGSETQEC